MRSDTLKIESALRTNDGNSEKSLKTTFVRGHTAVWETMTITLKWTLHTQ